MSTTALTKLCMAPLTMAAPVAILPHEFTSDTDVIIFFGQIVKRCLLYFSGDADHRDDRTCGRKHGPNGCAVDQIDADIAAGFACSDDSESHVVVRQAA